jgi:flagellin-like protein
MMRNITSIKEDEQAVSPVIGVILMVAVTVVLAATIGAFVFGLGDSLGSPAPNAQLDFAYDSATDTLAVSHEGGATLTAENTGKLVINGSDINSFPYSAGDQIHTVSSAGSNSPIDVVWVSPDGSQTQVLGTFEAP